MSDFFALSEEHQAIREAVRAVAEAKIAPYAAEVDEAPRFPSEANAALIASDFHAPHVPEQYGGAGADALATVLVIEEVARVCVSSSLIPAEEETRRRLVEGAVLANWARRCGAECVREWNETVGKAVGLTAPVR